MRNSAVKNFINTLGYDLACIYPLQLISSVIIARWLGAELKGVQTFIGLSITIILPLLFFGYGSGLKYFLTKKRIDIKNTGISSHVITLIVCTIFALILLLLWNLKLLGPSGNKLTSSNLTYCIVAIYISGTAYILNRILLGLSLFVENNRLNAIYQALITISLLISINIRRFDIDQYLMCYIFSKTIFVIGGLHILSYNKKYKLVSNLKDLKLIMSYGKKSWPNEVVNVFNTRIDQIIIAFIIPSELLGIYSIAVILSELSSRIPQAVSLIFFNKIAGYREKKSQIHLMLMIHKISLYTTFISTIISILISYFLIEKLFGADFKDAFILMIIYSPGVILFNSLRVFFQYFGAIGNPQVSTRILLKSLLFIIPTIFILTSNYSVYGAAAASSIGYLITFIFAIKYLKKTIKIKFSDFLLNQNDFTWIKDQIISLKQK